MLWLTKRTVRPLLRHVAHLAQAFLLERGVADGQHLVDQQDLGLEMGGDGEAEPHVHAAGVALDRRVEELLDLGEGDDLVELALRSRRGSCPGSRRSGRCSRARSAPGGSRCRPRAGCRRGRKARPAPAVGSVMRESSLSRVDLPAPLRPMMPSTSPGITSKLTSRSAHTWRSSSRRSPSRVPFAASNNARAARAGAVTERTMLSRSVR